MMGMTIMSLLVGVPARLSVQFARTNLVVRAGLASEPDLQRFRRPLSTISGRDGRWLCCTVCT